MLQAEIVSHLLMLLLPLQTTKDTVYRTIACKKKKSSLSNHLHTKETHKLGSLLAFRATVRHKIFRIKQLEAGCTPVHSAHTKQTQLLAVTFVSLTDVSVSQTRPSQRNGGNATADPAVSLPDSVKRQPEHHPEPHRPPQPHEWHWDSCVNGGASLELAGDQKTQLTENIRPRCFPSAKNYDHPLSKWG